MISAGWRKTNFTTTVSGTDATSGVQKIEWRVDGGVVVLDAAVGLDRRPTARYKLETRVTDVAGNASDWRVDTVAIDKVAPTLAVNCGAADAGARRPSTAPSPPTAASPACPR